MDTHSPITASRGSVWHRWDPHIHTPGTVLNDQFGGLDPWDSFLKKIETSSPSIRALGITDYLSIDRYEDVLRHKAANRIQNVALLFPNVEMRFGLETSKGSPINLHLLFSSEDPDHIEKVRGFLRKLEFRTPYESYCCCREDLIRLGKAHDSSAQDDSQALTIGTNQFKVGFDQLREAWDKSEWVRQNCLVAVAAGETDGTSGLRDSTGSFAALRKNIENFAHIVFSSNPKQVEFWLGRGAATVKDLETKWDGLKPCLHGSDAHKETDVGVPEKDRYCWLKGDLTFETLRQVCIEPADRVHIGAQPPRGALPGQTMDKVQVSNASWMTPSELLLNPGLIAIIGARGSGKTALADLIAAGGMAAGETLSDKSFLIRAREHLHESRADLRWEHGEITGTDLRDAGVQSEWDLPAVRYLSQQFVDELCSSEGLASSLVAEIERVIFNAHPEQERQGATSFAELSSLRSAAAIERRVRNEEELQAASNALAEERVVKQGLEGLKRERAELTRLIEQDKKDQTSLIARGHEVRAKRHDEVSTALEQRKREFVTAQMRVRALKALKEDTSDFRTRVSSNLLGDLKGARSAAGLSDSEWEEFRLEYVGDVDAILSTQLADAERSCLQIAGEPLSEPDGSVPPDPQTPLISANAELSEETVATLQGEATRLSSLIGIDAQNTKRFAALGEKIAKANLASEKLRKQIEHASGADERIAVLFQRRRKAYEGVFCAVIDLEAKLHQLYRPLAGRITGSAGALGAC